MDLSLLELELGGCNNEVAALHSDRKLRILRFHCNGNNGVFQYSFALTCFRGVSLVRLTIC